MIQAELIRRIAGDTGVSPAQVKDVLDDLSDKIAALKPGQEIRTTVLGTWSVTHQAGRMGRNPKTGAPAEIEAKNVMKFKPAKHIRDAINA